MQVVNENGERTYDHVKREYIQQCAVHGEAKGNIVNMEKVAATAMTRIIALSSELQEFEMKLRAAEAKKTEEPVLTPVS